MTPTTRRYLVALAIVVVGFCVGIPVYLLAPPEPPNPLEEWEQSKRYQSGLERVGGKSAVFGAEVTEAIESCFRGASLGITIGALSIVLAGGYLFFTRESRRRRGAPRGEAK